MQIFIDNEEVLCSQKMTIKEQLSNTSSVVLNNVYPKSWENDKDYVSRFYMPKDYSHCVITDDNVTKKKNIFDKVVLLDGRYVNSSGIMATYSNSQSEYIEVTPGEKYFFTIRYAFTSATMNVWTGDSLEEGTNFTSIYTLNGTTNTFEVVATKKYIIITKNWTSSNYATFQKAEQEIKNNVFFSGVVKNSGNIELNPRKPHYATLQLLDYKTFLSEGDTLNYVLQEQKVSEAIEKVVSELEGFEVGDIELDEDITIKPYNCNEKTPYDVFEYLAEITGAIWTTTTIDESTVAINFYSVDNLPMKDNIEYTQEYFEENNIIDIKYSYSSNDYRNKQVIVSEGAVADITQKEYLTYYGNDIKTTYEIGEIVSISIGTKEYSVGTNISKSTGSYADFYYTRGSNSIEVNKDFGTGVVFLVEYKPLVNTQLTSYNQTEIDRIAESTGRNGIIARYEKREDTDDENALAKISQTYLDFKGVPEITLTLKTHNKDIFNIGDRVFFNGPLESLKTTYLVISKEIDMITSGNEQLLFYTYKLSSSFNDENAINFFDNQRRKLEGNIEEGQYITRYIDIPSTTNIIFYDNSTSETEIPNDVLDGELDVELIGQNTHTAKLEARLEFKL